jgi:hypothetical protein
LLERAVSPDVLVPAPPLLNRRRAPRKGALKGPTPTNIIPEGGYMSNDTNTRIAESLYDRLADIIEYVTPDAAREVDKMINEGDLETAMAFMETLEAIYASDLR